jgi:MFS family permease
MRRLTWTVRILLAFESAMYTSVTPLLPHYARALHASTGAIGVLTAGYSAGLIPGALLGGWVAARHGVRRTTLVGLVGFGVAIAGFAVAPDLDALDVLRVVQGAFCGLIWGGGLTWVIAEAPAHLRGATIGGAIGAATLGTMLGPLLGTIALLAGTGPVFCATGAVSIALAGWTWRLPEPTARPAAGQILRQLRAALRAGGFVFGAWLITLEAILFGAATALLPLRMAHFGAPGWAVGAAFVGASALSALLAPVVGRRRRAAGGGARPAPRRVPARPARRAGARWPDDRRPHPRRLADDRGDRACRGDAAAGHDDGQRRLRDRRGDRRADGGWALSEHR